MFSLIALVLYLKYVNMLLHLLYLFSFHLENSSFLLLLQFLNIIYLDIFLYYLDSLSKYLLKSQVHNKCYYNLPFPIHFHYFLLTSYYLIHIYYIFLQIVFYLSSFSSIKLHKLLHLIQYSNQSIQFYIDNLNLPIVELFFLTLVH